jgi:hypothetical protein
MENQTTWSNLGYYGFVYVLIMLLFLAGYPILQHYCSPLATFLGIEGYNEPPVRMLAAVSGTYWGIIGIYALASRSFKDR